jgi:3-oxoacyl-ACP reductase-like protein
MTEPSKPRDALFDKAGEHGPPAIQERAQVSPVEEADAESAAAAVESMLSAVPETGAAARPVESPRPEIPPEPSPAMARLLRRLLRMRKSEPVASASIEGVISGLRRASTLQTALVDRASGAHSAGSVAIDAFAAPEEGAATESATSRPSGTGSIAAGCESSRHNRGVD